MISDFTSRILEFIMACNACGVKMILVGGGAVNFHGFQRHSADVDFWIDISDENLNNLQKALKSLGYDFTAFPKEVKEGMQNISIKISPYFDLELITRFNPGKSFKEAYATSIVTNIQQNEKFQYRVLNYRDLIESKIKSGRPKDLLDVSELKRLHAEEE